MRSEEFVVGFDFKHINGLYGPNEYAHKEEELGLLLLDRVNPKKHTYINATRISSESSDNNSEIEREHRERQRRRELSCNVFAFFLVSSFVLVRSLVTLV